MHSTHRVVTIVFLLLLTVSLGGCGGVPSGQLIGTWTVDRAATSQLEKPPRNIDAWVNKQFEFRNDSTLVITENGQATNYIYHTPSVDDDGWMKIDAQESGGSNRPAGFSGARFESDGSMQVRLTGGYLLVLTRAE